MHFGKEAVNWYAEPKYWPFILDFCKYLWKGVGYGCLIYISTINGIDPSLYEAASLDGATKWQQIKNITLPFLKPTVITLTLMSVGRIFYSDFGLFYQVPRDSGLLYSATNVIDTYVYRWPDEIRKCRNVCSSRLLSVHHRIYHCPYRKRNRT